MGLNRDKMRNIVSGITTPEPKAAPVPPALPPEPEPPTPAPVPVSPEPGQEGQGGDSAGRAAVSERTGSGDIRRFAKRGRPKGGKPPGTASTARKVKVSLFLSEILVNDLYEWAHADRLHPGEMFEMALKPFHEREAKRRKAGKE